MKTKLDANKIWETLKSANGHIVYKGIDYALLQQADLDNYGTDGESAFFAPACTIQQLTSHLDDYQQDVDLRILRNDPPVQVRWDIPEELQTVEDYDDYSSLMDWDNPSNVKTYE